MRVAFTALHTGGDYLEYAIRSVAPYVDRWLFAYSAKPSHGHGTDAPCPETEMQLHEIAHLTLAEYDVPYTWHRGDWAKEGDQRDMACILSPSAETIIVVDADEVWQDGAVEAAIAQAQEKDIQSWHVPFLHFWRSFGHVCTDAAQPTRVIRPNASTEHEGYIDCAPVFHFGYARKPADIEYKMLIHGHKGEWRPEWYEDKFLPWDALDGPHEDLHPTCHDNFWHIALFDKPDLPDFMRQHPYYGMGVIE